MVSVNTATRIKSEVMSMTDEKLERANRLKEMLDALNELKSEFEASYVTVNNVRSVIQLPKDILDNWKELNIAYFEDCIKDVEKEFKKL